MLQFCVQGNSSIGRKVRTEIVNIDKKSKEDINQCFIFLWEFDEVLSNSDNKKYYRDPDMTDEQQDFEMNVSHQQNDETV